MATIKTKFRSSSVEGREGTLYFQIIHGRVARQINTGYRLFPSEWDGRMSEIILPVSGDARRSLLLALKERMKKTFAVWKVSSPDWNGPVVPILPTGLWNFFTTRLLLTAIISWPSERG